LHQVGDLFELNVKLRCQKVKREDNNAFSAHPKNFPSPKAPYILPKKKKLLNPYKTVQECSSLNNVLFKKTFQQLFMHYIKRAEEELLD
jgi:hypothetical protein